MGPVGRSIVLFPLGYPSDDATHRHLPMEQVSPSKPQMRLPRKGNIFANRISSRNIYMYNAFSVFSLNTDKRRTQLEIKANVAAYVGGQRPHLERVHKRDLNPYRLSRLV